MANLTPEQLSAYNAAIQGGQSAWQDPVSGQTFLTVNSSGVSPELAQMMWGDPNAIGVGTYKPGGSYDIYDSKGASTGKTGTYGVPSAEKDFLTYMAILGGVGAAGGMFGAAGAGGSAGGDFASAAGAGDAYLPGATMGDAYLPGAMSIGGDLGAAAPLTGLDGYLAAGAGAAGGAVGGAAGGAAAGGAGAAGSALGGASSLLGPAATVLGAAAGAQGQNANGTQTKDIPEWLKPYAMKQLGYAGGLLDKQMAPGAMPGWEQMRNTGMGLLSQPIAGNGFNRLTGR